MTSYIGEAAVVMMMNVIVMGAIGIAAPTMMIGVVGIAIAIDVPMMMTMIGVLNGAGTAIDDLMTIAITDQAGAIAAQTMIALYVLGEFEIASRTSIDSAEFVEQTSELHKQRRFKEPIYRTASGKRPPYLNRQRGRLGKLEFPKLSSLSSREFISQPFAGTGH